jgi:hypothetical protein
MIGRWLLLALVVLVPILAEAAIVVTPPGVTCAADTRLTAPVTGQDFCFESTSNTLNNWSGAAWVPITLGGSQQSTNALTGLILANNGGDPTNDVDITVGLADSDDAVIGSRQQMSLTAALTKQLDVAWAVGTNQGMRSGAALADGTWHIFLIKRTDTGVVDVFADTSLAPTLPTNYTKKRRIRSIRRVGGAIVAEIQEGDYIRSKTPILDVNNVSQTLNTWTSRTVSVPTGIRVRAFGALRRTAGTTTLHVRPTDATDGNPSITVSPLGTIGDQAAGSSSLGTWECLTDTAAQIQTNSDATQNIYMTTEGYFDRRGRDN